MAVVYTGRKILQHCGKQFARTKIKGKLIRLVIAGAELPQIDRAEVVRTRGLLLR